MFNNVIIGVDGRRGGGDAIALGQDLVADDGRVTLAHVHGGLGTLARGSSYGFEAAQGERAENMLARARAEAGIEAELRSIGSTSVGRGLHEPTEDSITDVVDAARARIADLGDVEPHAVYGRPAEELALYGASLDLLVIGSRDYGPVARLVHGSTAQELARSARCPLLVLTRAARAGDTGAAEREPDAAARV